jgi:hypothetical protein
MQRAGYNYIWRSWKLLEHYQNAQDLVDEVYKENSHQPRQ